MMITRLSLIIPFLIRLFWGIRSDSGSEPEREPALAEFEGGDTPMESGKKSNPESHILSFKMSEELENSSNHNAKIIPFKSETLEQSPPICITCELIVAMNMDGLIGITDASGLQKIPWHLPEDLRHFKEKTKGHIVVMGRKTFDSLPNGPLSDRIHVVLTRTRKPSETPDSVIYTSSEECHELLLRLYTINPNKKIFICGGADIYRMFLDKCQIFHITVVQCKVELKDGEEETMFCHSIDNILDICEIGPCSSVLTSKTGIKYEFWEFVARV